VRRLVRLLNEPEEARRRVGLQWVQWRWQHQASARQGHVARRAAWQPLGGSADPPLPTVLAGTAALSDSLWQQIAPLLPPQQPPRGRPAVEHRRLLEGLLWIMHRGVPWREMPATYGSWHTAYSRYQRWCADGLWDRICAVLHPTPTRFSTR
jgi:Putative transposase of IS4/5 family (DUF4096)